MSVIDTLVTDRTQADVLALAEMQAAGWEALTDEQKAAWSADSKGAYNASDLNRVGEAYAYLYARLTRFGYAVPGYIAPKLDWTEADIPAASQMADYLATAHAIRAVLETVQEVPETMAGLTADGANDLEKMLGDVETTIVQMVYAMHRSAELGFYSGAAFIPTANGDFGRTWEELDAMNTTWRNWQVANWYLLLYGNLKDEGDVT